MLTRHTVLRVAGGKLLIPFIMLFALYVQFHGDYGPGGGFQAGVIFASGIILYAMIFGLAEAKRVLPPAAIETMIALGVLIYAATGVVCMLRGGAFLEYSALSPEDPVHGQHLGILIVELGVGITVNAVMIAIFYAFASRGEKQR